MNAVPAFFPSLAMLKAVKAAIETLRLPDDSGGLFQLVRLYDAADIDRAFADTLVTKQQRLCFVLPGRVSFGRETDGHTVLVKKRLQFSCLICDTDRKTGQEAAFGGTHNLGVIALSDLIVEGLTGLHLGYRGVCIEPEDGDEFSVTKEGDSDSGRKGWFQTFGTFSGKKGLSLYS